VTPDSPEFKAIHELTQQTDYRSLYAALIEVVSGLVPAATVRLFEAYDDRGHVPWKKIELEHLVVREFPHQENQAHPSWLETALLRATDQQQISVLTLADGETRSSLYRVGVLGGVWRFVQVDAPRLPTTVAETIACLVTIFSNQLSLLDRFEHDALTGLLNRQSFDYRFEDLIDSHRSNPNRTQVSSMPWLAISDIDYFKRINDTYGHLFGDEILLLFSRLLRQSFRFDDLLFRYGGEEFIVILTNTDVAGAAKALERFRKTIEDYDFSRVGQVTVSIGWVAVDIDDLATNIIHKADKALYRAKSHGRNLVVSYEQEFGDADDDIKETIVVTRPDGKIDTTTSDST
jgi:diguanylate cyclase (GGDEF)-like protein